MLLYLFCNKSHYENVPFEIPESWCWTTVSAISKSILYGVSESAKACGKYRLLRITDIQNNNVQWNNVPYTDFDNNKAESYLLNDGDILFARTGATVGKSYLVQGLTEKAIYASYLIRVQTYDAVLPQYIKFYFESGYYWEQIEQESVGVGQPNVNGSILGNLQIPIPPIHEQNRIVLELTRWKDIIDAIEDGTIELESYVKQTKSKILDLAISGKLVPQDPNEEPAIELLKRINPAFKPCDNSHYENLPFEIPSTWVWVSHNDMLEISGGAQPPKSEFSEIMKPGYIRLYQIRDYGEKPIPIYIPLSTASKTTVKGDILLARYGGSLGKVFIAEDGAYNVAMAKVILCYPEVLNQKFVYYYYLSSIYQNKLRSISRTAQAGFNSGDFEDMYFPLPPLEEQGRIVDAISSIWEMIDMITAEL